MEFQTKSWNRQRKIFKGKNVCTVMYLCSCSNEGRHIIDVFDEKNSTSDLNALKYYLDLLIN